MATNTPEPDRTFATRKVTRPAVEVDCSGWVDTATGWTCGDFVTKPSTRPGAEVDCSGWDAGSAVWLELVVSFGGGADATRVQSLTTKLVQAARDAAPELGLAYDPARSGARGGAVVVALTPRDAAGTEDHLGRVIRRVREAVADAPELALTSAGLRWAG